MLARADRFERGGRSLNPEAVVEIDSMTLMHDIHNYRALVLVKLQAFLRASASFSPGAHRLM